MRESPRVVILAAILLAGIVELSGIGTPGARASDFSEFLHSVFGDKRRAQSGTDLNYYANIYRTQGPLESLMRIVASNDYFYNECQQNANLYVTRLYQIFLRRDPQLNEQQYWASRVPRTSSDARLTFVRQFCQANNISYYYPSTPTYPRPPVRPTDERAELARSLVAKSTQLTTTIQNELGGTFLGRDLLLKATVLVSASRQYQDAALANPRSPQQLTTTASSVDRALRELEILFRKVPAASGNTQNQFWDVSRIVASMVTLEGIRPSQPIEPTPVEREAQQLVAVLRQFASLVYSFREESYFYVSLYRDASGLAVQAESLQQLARSGANQRDMQRMANNILTQAREIARRMSDADVRVRQSWWNVQHELDQLANLLGIGGDLYVSADHPVIINHPGWNGFPVQPSPGYQTSSDNREIVTAADELVQLIDQYVSKLRPIASRNRDAARMVDSALDLQHQAIVVRQQAATGTFGTRLQVESREMLRLYTEVASQTYLRMVGEDPSLATPTWTQIGQLARRIDRRVGATGYRER